MTRYRTEQEQFWAGEFGAGYRDRNVGPELVAANIALFARILARTAGVGSLLELGANRGLNLIALRSLLPGAKQSAVEINAEACAELRQLGFVDVEEGSLLDERTRGPADLVLVKGVLIHLNPDHLPSAYAAIHRSAAKYVVLAEYYNPTPVAIEYRGHADRLFKRDFAGEMLDRYPDLQLVDYGFAYRRDPAYPQDDITWFLLEKRQSGDI
jgi:pseudaminic acid biosynthesis-associated methylase